MLYDYILEKRMPLKKSVNLKDPLFVSKEQHAMQNKTILFESEDIPVIGNIWCDRVIIAKELNTDISNLSAPILRAIETPLQPTLFVSSPYKKTNLSLSDLPVPKYFSYDGGRYITAGIVSAVYNSKENLSYHRIMLKEKNRAAIRIVERHLYSMYSSSINENKDFPVAIVIGAPLPFMISASISFEYERSEIAVANALYKNAYKEEMEFTKIHGITVPADCGMILYGKIKKETAEEGPFCDIMMIYDAIRLQPVLEIEEIYLSNKPFLHSILPGGLEHKLMMGLPREAGIYRSVSSVVPGLKSVRLTEGGGGWLHGIISIKKVREGDGKNAIISAFTGHPSMKQVIVVDDDIDIFNNEEVEWAIATRFQGDKGLVLINNTSGSSLDPSIKLTGGYTSKMGIDATLPVKEMAIIRDGSAFSPFRKASF